MGWARTLLLGDIGNRMDIADTEYDIELISKELRRQRVEDADLKGRISSLQAENESLELGIAALIKMLERKGLITNSEVEALVDLTEGGEHGSIGTD